MVNWLREQTGGVRDEPGGVRYEGVCVVPRPRPCSLGVRARLGNSLKVT